MGGGDHGGGGGSRRRGIEWGKISLLAWFAIFIVWWADGHPGRLQHGLHMVHVKVFQPIFSLFRSLLGG